MLRQVTMSLDGLVPGPDHAMDWLMDDLTNRPGVNDDGDPRYSPTVCIIVRHPGWR